MAKLLLEKGADPKLKTIWRHNDVSLASSDCSPMEFACLMGKVGVVKLLVDYGVDVTARDSIGYTALHCACEKGHFGLAKLLVDLGADVNATTYLGDSILHAAC